MPGSGVLQPVLNDTRLDDGGTGLRIEGENAVEVGRSIDNQPCPNCIASARRTGPAGGDGQAYLACGCDEGRQFVSAAGMGDRGRNDAVDRGVRGVKGARQPGIVEDLQGGGIKTS